MVLNDKNRDFWWPNYICHLPLRSLDTRTTTWRRKPFHWILCLPNFLHFWRILPICRNFQHSV